MNIIKTIKHWYYYWRFRYMMWKLNRAMNNFSRSIGIAFIPVIENAITAFSALGEAFQQSVQPTDGGLAQADDESNPPTISG
mgnify:CR=1 FL=1